MKIIRSIFIVVLLAVVTINVKAQASNATINNVVAAYLEVKNALAADNGKAAQARAKVLSTQIAAVQLQDENWKKYADKLSFDSRHISETDAIAHQREHFASLSKNFYAVVKSMKANAKTLYWQYCPMKKSSWLSDVEAIENPYYGKEMLECGSVKETLKAAK
ncbi:DUF3347 domain-containing protein [Mucilaginibacter sp. UYCu711]|uniref:DUF3347 domain-containing protein n=1 Tax=Mucilaginibacter sp. UYCu711 TaxID=3156339 RepID=UPI003D19C184